MRSEFVKTTNVKNFITLTNNLINQAEGVPGLALVYGEPGLGKTQVVTWWAANNDAILVSAKQSMTQRWLLEEIVKEIGDIPLYKTSDLFDQITRALIKEPKIIIVDEIDYLANEKSAIEILRDIHDRTKTPIIMVGMSFANKTLKRYKHLYDRFSEILQFTPFSLAEINKLITELSEVKFSPEAISYVYQTGCGFRQIVKLINKAESVAEANDLTEINLKCITNLLRKELK